MEQKARRRRVPAFGEWNYNYYGSSAELATPAAPAELEARSDVWFKYSPPPRKPPPPPAASRKVRRPAADRSACGGSGKRPRAATPARASDAVVPSSSSVPRTPAKSAAGAARARVVRRVDADLYQVPPPDLLHDEDLPPRVAEEGVQQEPVDGLLRLQLRSG
ncbi:hypothetical protein Zm00014a_015278 [Zea mays]|uniref:Uncharacterized protein n=2 Tax=Zea mays TaxID=4577 RepID=A0A8J8XJL7_MAIZE|nr:uncharacterized protein LOC100275059 isoform X2 [Zea mays]ONM35767.1 hypothetical protein ZEAMMB73_Zm00001d042554 [Zea mays]PWZ34302.1 hypothetical protein Zm00014a_015278 [Zea mays]|eukprot:XP_008672552.1 uncharacterized protein LOC100275059 isoform X2 [Zea mays]